MILSKVVLNLEGLLVMMLLSLYDRGQYLS